MNVEPSQWLSTVTALRDSGHTYLDFLAATDDPDGTSVVAHLVNPSTMDRVMLRTFVGRGEELPSIVSVFPAAGWHEREAHELVGIAISGNPDLRPLVLVADQVFPLRRDAVLKPRVENKWPGLYEPGAEPGTTRRRREKQVPGNPPEWTQP